LILAVLALQAVERHEPATLEVAIASPEEPSPHKTGKKASREIGVISELESERSTPSPGHARRRDALSSVAPVAPGYERDTAFYPRIHRSHPVDGSSFRFEFSIHELRRSRK
jgi:hypothetical protein